MSSSDSAEKGKTVAANSSAKPILPAANSKGEPAAGNGKPATSSSSVRVQLENDSSSTRVTGGSTINQQLATHLASQMTAATSTGVKLPAAKRKRGSLDSPLTGFKMKHNIMHIASDSESTKRIGFIGAGNIARAIVEGWIAGGHVKPVNITATVRTLASSNMKLMKSLGVNVSLSNQEVIGQCDMIIVAVKPYQVMEVMQDIHQTFKTAGGHTPKSLRPLIVSVAASVPLQEIERKAEIIWNIGGSTITGHLPIIRCIPNIGCAVQSGVTVFTRGRFCNEEDVKPFVSLFSLLGHCEEIEEKYMDGFVALTGSGLAFMEVALEAMADGGVLAGIPHAISLRMSAHTMIGAAKLILKKGLHPAQVKNAVASPAGTTISGILALEDGGFRAAMISAVKAAVDKAVELRQS